jgi:tetratricopeptide (TPR) repeat protein
MVNIGLAHAIRPYSRYSHHNSDSSLSFNTLAVNKSLVVSSLMTKARDIIQSGNYTEAMNYFDKALSIDPNNVSALNGKGAALSGLKNYTGSIQYYDKALDIDPNFVKALTNRGLVLNNLKTIREQ